MSGLTWLHISDWHHKDFPIDPEEVRDGLVRDIEERLSISPDLEKIDFIVFSGDASSGGRAEEYEDVKKEFFERILKAAGDVSPRRLFIVPGNHDLDEAELKKLPVEFKEDSPTREKVDQWLKDDAKRELLLQPFRDFRSFVSGYTGQDSPDYSNVRTWKINGKVVSLLGINSAWFCRRHYDAPDKPNDYGFLRVGKRQIHERSKEIEKSDFRIAVLHHSQEWLEYYDGEDVWKRLKKSCHFILHGHGHELDVSAERGTKGDFVLIPTGAIFDQRVAKDPNRIYSYNFVHLNIESGKGTVFLRCWNDTDFTWTSYNLKSPEGRCPFDLPGSFGHSKDFTASSGPRQIRSPPDEFIGRKKEIEVLLQGFERGAVIARLGGMGGEGKTTLAYVLAKKLAGSYPDGQLFLDMRGTSNSPLKPDDAMAHVIRSYKGADCPLPKDFNSLLGLYRTVLSDKKVLILLDNAANREQVEPILPPPGSISLVTSRIKFALPGLLEEMDLDPGVLPQECSEKLLQKICGRIGDHAEELAKLCGCLPLALRNAAYDLKEKPNISVADYMKRLGDARKRLELVEASFSTSYELLTPELQKLWCLLSVFPADFDLLGAAAVWEMEQVPAEDALGELVKWSLVDFMPSAKDEGGRYKLHDLARVFSDSCLEAGAREPAQQRHAKHYQELLWKATELFLHGGKDISISLEQFDSNWMNIRAGQKWAKGNMAISLEIAEICSNFARNNVILRLRLHPRENIEWLEAALVAACQTSNKNAEGAHLADLGLAHFDLGDSITAIKYYERSRAIFRELRDYSNEGNVLVRLGLAHAALGDARKAIEFYVQALSVFREIGNKRGKANTLGNLGNAYGDLGDIRKAIVCYEEQQAITHQIEDRPGESIVLGNLGVAHAELGNIISAIKYFEQGLFIAHEIGNRHGEGVALTNLGLAHARQGDLIKAIEFHLKALAIFSKIEDRPGEVNALGNLGLAHFHLGETRKANEHYEQALVISCDIGDRRGEGRLRFNMSLSLYNLGQREMAISFAKSALEIFEQIESPHAETVRKALAEWNS